MRKHYLTSVQTYKSVLPPIQAKIMELFISKLLREEVQAILYGSKVGRSNGWIYLVMSGRIKNIRKDALQKMQEYLDLPDKPYVPPCNALFERFFTKANREGVNMASLGRRVGISYASLRRWKRVKPLSITYKVQKRMEDYVALPDRKEEPGSYLRQAVSAATKGPHNVHWKGGVALYPNHAFLKRQIIQKLKDVQSKCEICKERVQRVFHLDGDFANHEMKNLVASCNKCYFAIHRKEKIYK